MEDYTDSIAPKLGETRITKRFAWLPIKCGDHWVWFRHYRQLERYSLVDYHTANIGLQQVQQWAVLERYCF